MNTNDDRATLETPCTWAEDAGTWTSKCGYWFDFNDGTDGPVDAEWSYCPKCGHVIAVAEDEK